MERKSHVIAQTVIKSLIIIAIMLGFGFILKTTNIGIVVDRIKLEDGTRKLIYGDFNLSLIKWFSIISLILLGLLLVFYIIKNTALIQEKEYAIKLDKPYPYVEFLVLGMVILFSIFLLTVYPRAQDKRNYHAFGFSLANIIMSITLIGITIYNKWIKSNVEVKQISINIVAEGSIMAALAIVLSLVSDFIPGLKLPNGGSFSLSMLPLFIFALRRGFGPGVIVGFVYGWLNFLIDGNMIHWGSIFFDYLIPYTLLAGVAGLFSKSARKGNIISIVVAVLLGGFLRYISHGFSGVLFFAEYAGDNNPWFYSFILYNLPYMAVSTIGSLIFTLLLKNQFIVDETKIY